VAAGQDRAVTRFEATVESADTVPADAEQIWAVLTDPEALTRLTPMLERVEPKGETWVWHMVHVSGLGVGIVPVFTEKMDFQPPKHIGFTHAPPPGSRERVWVGGTYDLTPVENGTRLAIVITVGVDLPLPGAMRPAVTRFIRATMNRTGDRFAKNLLAEITR
jgi:carbon monoxide dehydrogenase subunit G